MRSIVARYTRDDKEYAVVATGHDTELNGTAPDIVAARKLVDEFVNKIAAEPPNEPVVVHLLDNSAVEFTRAYLDATLFGHQPNRETDAPQSAEEKSTDNTKNDIAKNEGASSS